MSNGPKINSLDSLTKAQIDRMLGALFSKEENGISRRINKHPIDYTPDKEDDMSNEMRAKMG